jgi:hypothetical protein
MITVIFIFTGIPIVRICQIMFCSTVLFFSVSSKRSMQSVKFYENFWHPVIVILAHRCCLRNNLNIEELHTYESKVVLAGHWTSQNYNLNELSDDYNVIITDIKIMESNRDEGFAEGNAEEDEEEDGEKEEVEGRGGEEEVEEEEWWF